MKLRNAVLGGVLLLVAGCTNGVHPTAPVEEMGQMCRVVVDLESRGSSVVTVTTTWCLNSKTMEWEKRGP